MGSNDRKAGRPAGDAVKLAAGQAEGLAAAARVVAAGGRVPKKFVKARPASAGPTLEAATARAKITPARRVAYEILTLVAEAKGHSDELLHGVRMEELSEADKHLATALVMGVLRWQIALDARVRGLLERPGQSLPEAVALVLRMGAFQLLHMDRIPAHAALSESVEMARAAGHPYAAGMVNAVLRRVAAGQRAGAARQGASGAGQPGAGAEEAGAGFAERLGHPRWMVERWVARYGREAALRICEAGQREAGQREAGAGGLFAESAEGLPHMDDGSRLVAELAAAAMPEVEGRTARVWDCCAAPGGKTLLLALRASERAGGAEVLATDVSAKRMKQMEARMRRFAYAAKVKTKVADVLNMHEEAGEFDLILCDVPCSGTGTLGRNPEIRLRLKPEELRRQAERQRGILAGALARLAPGGRLVYSTCSLEPEENEEVVKAAAEGWRRVPLAGLLGRVPGLLVAGDGMVEDGALRTLPGTHACDGFYAVVLERGSKA